MLTTKQLIEIREHLEKAQNPLFLFDNDVDGLCSAMILQRVSGKGKAFPIKSFPGLDAKYLRRVEELNADYVFIMDKAEVELDFLQGVSEKGIPIVCIDHHPVDISQEKLDLIHYYSSAENGGEPTTFLAQMVYERKEDEWLAMVGCIGDVYKPFFSKSYAKENPELFNNELTPFNAMYMTEVGRITTMLNFGLKDTTTNVVNLMKLLVKANNLYDLLEENSRTRALHYKYKTLSEVLEKQVEKGNKNAGKNLVYLEYSGETSMSSEVSNRLMFEHPEKSVVIIFRKQDTTSVSLRGPKAKRIVEDVVLKIPGAKGGGHEVACGAKIPLDEIENFKKALKEYLKEE
ncbi:DHH family phosphoesterase [archaeon]|nr:DHH family phosphoesterase [archaeon]